MMCTFLKACRLHGGHQGLRGVKGSTTHIHVPQILEDMNLRHESQLLLVRLASDELDGHWRRPMQDALVHMPMPSQSQPRLAVPYARVLPTAG